MDYDDINDQIEILDDHQELLRESELQVHVEQFELQNEIVPPDKIIAHHPLENENINSLSLQEQMEDEDEFKRMKEDFNSMNSLSESLALNGIIGKTSDVVTSEQMLASPGALSGAPFDL